MRKSKIKYNFYWALSSGRPLAPTCERKKNLLTVPGVPIRWLRYETSGSWVNKPLKYIKIQLDSEAWRTQTKEMKKHGHSISFCPLKPGCQAEFNISKVVYCVFLMFSPRVFFYYHVTRFSSSGERYCVTA